MRRAGVEMGRGSRAVRTIGVLAAVWVGVAGSGAAGAATPDATPTSGSAPTSSDAQTAGVFGFANNLSRSSTALGDMFGLRPALSQAGVTLSVLETSEVLGNVTGGTRRGADYDGLTTVDLQLDTQRAFGWYGGTFNASALQIHGRNLSTDNLQTLQTASGIEADRATRLWELWYQQKFLDEDRLDVKVGQQSLDQEFMVSTNALYFVNTMFGWAMVPSADLPGGGPAYPLSALGARVRARPTDSITLLAGVFNGSPVHNNNGGDPQRDNPSGTSFPLNGGVLAIAELQYSYPALGLMVSPDEREPLPRLYKIGMWYDTQRFDDQRFDNTGLSLSDPNSSGMPRRHSGNYSFYATADQMIWRDDDDQGKNINLFMRAMGTPRADRNLISFSLNAGVTMHSPFPNRDQDTAGLGLGYAKVSNRAGGADRDANFYGNTGFPVRGSETFIEATYQYQALPWLQLQPDVQYTFHVGGGIADPNTGQRIKNELVLGLRTNILF